MYIMKSKKARWTIASARQRLPTLIRSAASEPQAVYRRNKLVASVVSPELFLEMERTRMAGQRPRLADALAELRRLCAEEAYELQLPARRNRSNPFSGRRR
jgi:PHD/YefM family antitoxin component YafN of YafNO toxin-antitoxin module